MFIIVAAAAAQTDNVSLVLGGTAADFIGMYRIAIFKIQPEPDSTGYETNYPAETRYLDTRCIIAIFFGFFVVQIKNVLFPVFVFSFVCSHTA